MSYFVHCFNSYEIGVPMDDNKQVLLVDDHDLVLQGLKSIIETSLPEINRIFTASDGNEALQLAGRQQFDLYILDMELPDMSGMDLIDGICGINPDARIMVNTVHEEVWFIKELIMRSVSGILFKSVDSSMLIEAVRKVLCGENYYCPYAEKIALSLRRSSDGQKDDLTLRELDVLNGISEGKSTAEIADDLCVSVNTVDTHRRHLMEKLGARNAADLIMTALSKGLIALRKY